jgi:hypothetical protein
MCVTFLQKSVTLFESVIVSIPLVMIILGYAICPSLCFDCFLDEFYYYDDETDDAMLGQLMSTGLKCCTLCFGGIHYIINLVGIIFANLSRDAVKLIQDIS